MVRSGNMHRWSLTLLAALGLSFTASADDWNLSAPAFLPGDTLFDAAAGDQMYADLARGGDQFLAVWTDYRSAPETFVSEGSGADIYGARLDAAGGPIDVGPIMINQGFGEQVDPRVAWNGENWLVIWETPKVALPTYAKLQAARVGPDGTVLDDPPIEVHDADGFFSGFTVAGGNGGWVVLFEGSQPAQGLHAVAIAGDGTVQNPGGMLLHPTLFGMDFDLAFAGDEYLIAWGGTFDSPRAQRFTPGLLPIDPVPFAVPNVQRVASDGTDFLIAWQWTSGLNSFVQASRVSHGGVVLDPVPIDIDVSPIISGISLAWDGTYYWIHAPRSGNFTQFVVVRVAPDGTVLDPSGLLVNHGHANAALAEIDSRPGGGIQAVWNDGNNGAIYPKDVYAAPILSGGQLGQIALVSGGSPAQLNADLTAGGGMFVVAFESRTSGQARILAQRLDAAGEAIDAEPVVVAAGVQVGNPGVAFDGTRYLITWHSGNTIFARRMLTDGTLLDSTPINVMPGITPDAAGMDGTFLVVGTHILLGNSEWRAAFSRRLDGATGAILDPQPMEIGNFAIFAQFPHVVRFGDQWLVTYQRNISHDEPAAGTSAAFVHADGTSPGIFEVGINWRPDVAASQDRALFVAVTNTIASATTDIRGRMMLADGTFVGGSFLITQAPEKQLVPTVAFDGENFLVAWEDRRNAAIYFDERTDIYGSRVSPAGAVLEPAGVALAAASVPEVDPALLSAGGTTLLAVSTLRPEPDFGAYRVGIRSDAHAPVPGDVDGNGVVGVGDLLALLAAWGPCGGCPADLDGDGMAGVGDLLIVLANWD